MPTSKANCMLDSSNDVKKYKSPLQTITKYFAASSRSKGIPPEKLADSPVLLANTKGTLILQESSSDSSPNSSGVCKVTAKPTIDVTRGLSDPFLLDGHFLIPDLKPSKLKEQFKETVSNNIGKRAHKDSSKSPPAKKAKSDQKKTKVQEITNASKHKSSSNIRYSCEFREDEEENKVNLVNGEMESTEVYFCKHCDYSGVSIRCMSMHYQKDHPYIRYNTVYIRDPSDQSATFRCLECPVEFSSAADLKIHYKENHPEAQNVFMVQSHEHCLVFKCFVCPFTTNALKALKEHHQEKHPTHKVDNPLMYCRYLATRSPEGRSPFNTCEKAPSPERPRGISHGTACTPCKEVKNATSPQHPTSKGADVALYHCNNCRFSHKSAVVMHVHYQKSHPEETVTIEKFKQSPCVTSHTASQMAPDKSRNSVTIIEKSTPQKNISDSSEETRNKTELSQKNELTLSLMNLKHTPEASKTHSESAKTKKVESVQYRSKGKKSPNKRNGEMSPGMDSSSSISPNELFYCQFCRYSNTNIKSVVSHHNAKHSAHAQTGIEEILRYSAEVHEKKLQSKAEASARTSSSDSKSSTQVEIYSEVELQHEEDAAADASMTKHNAYSCAENLFYCQRCNYGNTSVQGVLTHQARVHQSSNSRQEHVIEYTALIHDKIEKTKSQVKELPFLTHLPLPLMNEGDEDMFFCHFCNYRQSTVNKVLHHYFRKHRGFVVKGEQVRLYTSMVLRQTQTSHLKAAANQEVNCATLEEKGNVKKKIEKLGKVSASPSTRASQTRRTLQCHRCLYSTQYVYLLRRHMFKIHKANHTVAQILNVCFKQGTLQTGYHCDMCVFSHEKAIEVYKHYRQQHTGRKLSLEYVSNRLYVGSETRHPIKKEPQIQTDGSSNSDGTDCSLPSQRSGQNETKTFSCRACSFKGNSMSSITRHYRAVHPWSVKEDGSVLDVINSKKQSANRLVEDHNEMPVSFDTCQAGTEFDDSPGSSHEPVSSTSFNCSLCPARFSTQRGLSTHFGIKHQKGVTVNVDEQQEKQKQILTRVHVFKCPHCTYVNTNYQGVLTHCQMRHPGFASRADSLYLNGAHLHSWEDCLKRKGPGLRLTGYMCKTCQEIYATLEKLNKHCEMSHKETVANTMPNMFKTASKPSAVSKKKSKFHSNKRSVSKASFFSKKKFAVIRCQYCSYVCTTKLAFGRHLLVHHKSAPAAEAQDCPNKCTLCSKSYFKKSFLGSHYAKKHGKAAFLKYHATLYKQVKEKPAPTIPDCPFMQQQGDTSEACISSITSGKSKKLVYKCPSCPYVNVRYHGTLTHCQMKHPDLIARADDLQTDEILLTNMVMCKTGRSSNETGYMCSKCPQVHVSLKNLIIHCERSHDQAEATAPEHSVETESEKQPDHGSRGSVLESVSLKSQTSAVSTTEIGLSHQMGTPETCQSNTLSVKNKGFLYKCHICTYMGSYRKYLYCHYKYTHKLDAFTTRKLLQKYNKRNKASNLPEAKSEGNAHIKCKICPNLKFDSSQLLIAHYSTFHSSDCVLDFIVLPQASKKNTALYKCALCKKQMNGIKKLWHHLDGHREGKKNIPKTSLALTTTPEAKSIELCRQDELPTLETVEELAQWNVTPVETFTLPPSPLLTSSVDDLEESELESREGQQTCKQCGRKFMSLKGLRSHERSHAALAAIKKKLNNLSTSKAKHNIKKYINYKPGTMKPFTCSLCSYRTNFMGLWRSHFIKKHQDVIMDPSETADQDEESAQTANKEPPNSAEELNNLPELDEEPEITERSLYLEPPDVQRQLNHYILMAKAGASPKVDVQETKLPDNSLLHCEVCNFSTGHLSSMRRHYLNRHGKKILRCKDCNFFTGLRRTLEMHMETGHSTCQSEPTHQKDLCCPFCLYQTKNKNNMIDHIVLHREERVVPIEVRRSKLSHYLQGIVFRCHKCTFTSGSAENLHLHMMRHDDVKPYKCRLCYFDCTRLNDLEAHLSDKHQVVRNHELVGQINLDQLEARVGRMTEEEENPLSDPEHQNNDSEDVKTEEVVTNCNEVSHETQAKNLTERNIRENITQQMKEAYQKQGQDDKNENEERPVKSSVLDLQYVNKKPNSIVQEKHEQDSQEQAAIVFLPDTERRERIKKITKHKIGEGTNADIQFEDCSYPQIERQTNANQTQSKHRGREDSSVAFTQPKEEAAEGSSTTCGKIAEKSQTHKLHIKAQKHRALNIEAKIEDDILRHILLLDEDGSIRKKYKMTNPERTVKIEQSVEPEVADNVQNEIPLLYEESTINLAHNRKNQGNAEAISAFAKKNYGQANNFRDQERFAGKRHFLTLLPNCGQLKIGHKEILGVSFTNCKEEQVQNQENYEEIRDSYVEMPVLENAYLKEEMHPTDCCKGEDQNDHLEQKQDKEDEMITKDVESGCTTQKREDGEEIKETENPDVPKGALEVTDGEAEVFCPAATENKLFTCEFCGRNLTNSSELGRHVMRHGI